MHSVSSNHTGTGPRGFAFIWVPSMYSSEWQKNLASCPLPFTTVSTFDALKEALRGRLESGLLTTAILVDGNLIQESGKSLYAILRPLAPDAELTIIVPPDDEKANPKAQLGELSDIEDSHLTVMPSDKFAFSVYLESLLKSVSQDTRGPRRQVQLAQSRGLPPDDPPLNDNELSQAIGTELATISASIHLDQRLLDDGYVVTTGTLLHPSALPEKSSLSQQEYDTAVRRWREQERSRSDFAKEVVYQAMVSPASQDDGNAFLAHVALSQLLEVPTRRTYLVLGAKGSGKTTFMHFYRLFYAPRRMIFVVDFLPFNFTADAQNLYLKLETQLFSLLKRSGACRDIATYTTHYDYRAAIGGRAPSDLWKECTRLGLTPDISFLQSWIEEVLFSCPSRDLVAIWQAVTNAVDSPASNAGARDAAYLVAARKWRDVAVSQPTPELIQIMSDRYRDTWLRSPVDWLCQSIIEDATEMAHCAARDSSDRSLSIRRALEALGSEHGITWDHLTEQRSIPVTQLARSLLGRLSATDGPVVVCIDNADRAVATLSEIEIFKQSWEFLFGHTDAIKMVCAVRDETYAVHQAIFDQIDQRLPASTTTEHTHRVANIAKIYLHAPTFKQVAHARVYAVNHLLERRQVPPKTKDAFHEYVCAALATEGLDGLFATMFGGDIRLNLDLFEAALRSPHIVESDLYFRARQRLRQADAAKDVNAYVQRHRLFTALMLRNHERFVQRRPETAFLNMYNAHLIENCEPREENALLLHRTLAYVRSSVQSSANEVLDKVSRGVRVPVSSVEKALLLLLHYGLVRAGDGGQAGTGLPAMVRITPNGEYYLTSLMARLEYIETVYWEIWVDEDLVFGRFPIGDLGDLLPFVDFFAEFLVRREAEEAQRNLDNPEYRRFIARAFRDIGGARMSEVVKRATMGQVMRIYFAERQRV